MSDRCITSKDGFTVALHAFDQQPRMISSVRSGLECNCLCMGCGRKLVAVHPKKISAYFKHYSPVGTAFTGCPESKRNSESITHFLTKHHIAKTKQLHVPPLSIFKTNSGKIDFKYKSYTVRPARILKFDEVLLEKRQGAIIPDCIGIIGERRLYIEVKVTHGIDSVKLAKIKEMKATTIEMYVQGTVKNPESPYLEKLVNNPDHLEWIHAPILDKQVHIDRAEGYFKSQLEAYEAIDRARKEAEEALILESYRQARPSKVKSILKELMSDWDAENLNIKNLLSAEEKIQLRHDSSEKLSSLGLPACTLVSSDYEMLYSELEVTEIKCQQFREAIDSLRSSLPNKYQVDIVNRDPRNWIGNVIKVQVLNLEIDFFQIWLSGMKEEEKMLIGQHLSDLSEEQLNKHEGIRQWRSEYLSKEAFVLATGGISDEERFRLASLINKELKPTIDDLIIKYDELDLLLSKSLNTRSMLESQISNLGLKFTQAIQEYFVNPLPIIPVYMNSIHPKQWLQSLQDRYYHEEVDRVTTEWRSSRKVVRKSAWNDFTQQIESKSDEEIYRIQLAEQPIVLVGKPLFPI